MPTGQRLQRFISPMLIAFMTIVAGLVLVVLYVAFSKTIITVTLAAVPATISFHSTPEELGITVTTLPIDETFTFTDYESSSDEAAIARGTVTLVNEYTVDQPLVRTTRLLSTEGVLFHTDETVTVPAGGSIVVAVYADQPGASGNIFPSQFEIVALHSNLKSKIYATSSSAMTGGVIKKVTLTDELIQQAEAAASAAITAQLETNYDPENLIISLTDQTVNGVSGDTVESVTVHTTGSARYVPVTTELLQAELQTDSVVSYTLETDGSEVVITGEAAQNVELLTEDFIDPAILTGKTEQQIQDYLADFKQVKRVDVSFVPFWLDRTPQLAQQIRIEIVEYND